MPRARRVWSQSTWHRGPRGDLLGLVGGGPSVIVRDFGSGTDPLAPPLGICRSPGAQWSLGGVVADVVFVREIAGGRDLVLAIDHDGRPAWALDLDRDLQWWYPGGDTPGTREAIADAWPSLWTLPVAAVTPTAGPHPAVELGRRAERAAYSEPDAPPPADDLVSLLVERWSRLSRPARLGLAALALAACVVLVSVLLGGVSGTAPVDLPVGDDGMTVTTVQTAGTPCQTRGLLAYDAEGHRLVCVPPTRAIPSALEWRPVG